MNFNEREEALKKIDFKLSIFEKCINEIGLLKTYPYVDSLEKVLLGENSTKDKQYNLMKECTKRKLNELSISNTSFINNLKQKK